MALLVYGEVAGISYVEPPGVAVFLSPEQQSFVVQASHLFNSPSLWSDYDDHSDDIDALVAASELALLTYMDIPPNTAPRHQDLFHINSSNQVGNALSLSIQASQMFNHAAFQNPPAINDEWRTPAFWLSGDVANYGVELVAIRNGVSGIVTLELRRKSDNAVLASLVQDLYSAVAAFNQRYLMSYAPSADELCYLSGRMLSKNVSSTGYQCLATAVLIRS